MDALHSGHINDPSSASQHWCFKEKPRHKQVADTQRCDAATTGSTRHAPFAQKSCCSTKSKRHSRFFLPCLLIDLPPPLCKEFLHLPTHRITACLLNEKVQR